MPLLGGPMVVHPWRDQETLDSELAHWMLRAGMINRGKSRGLCWHPGSSVIGSHHLSLPLLDFITFIRKGPSQVWL